ncbi:squalene synthase HpnC [Novosphingobium sp. G106]|uniref:squalene synthase HpnC n=1 Tax=Novosphingobium sp. G106 TaxID=2849500 RepID=UPI001C2D7680|nr:squalene synthase HpnC [Novosphingobium sp. G106]MBV1688648.1 squalene synthase HpnC [Novosphingobium sp. G106]
MSDLSSGKGHRDENFPVASFLLKPEHRAPIMAFYRFARAADDIADHAEALETEKLRLLGEMRAGLAGNGAPEAMALAKVAHERQLDLVHAHELLDAFTQDVMQRRYADWDALIAYCRLSAVPVGRFVLDVHGEDRSTWPLSDALCAALQVINHLQDCGEDYRDIDRVYVPLDALAEAGIGVEALGESRASPALRQVIAQLAGRTQGLLAQSAPFASAVGDRRLSAEVAVIQAQAEDLARLLTRRDPLSEPVHHSKLRMGSVAIQALLRHWFAGDRA